MFLPLQMKGPGYHFLPRIRSGLDLCKVAKLVPYEMAVLQLPSPGPLWRLLYVHVYGYMSFGKFKLKRIVSQIGHI